MHIYLVGFMGCGKSRIGAELGRLMQWPFTDLDRRIEQVTGPLVPFFRTHGENAFRERESEVLRLLAASHIPNVVATGGGTLVRTGNREVMEASGRVVWLDVPVDVLVERLLRTGRDRPLLFGLNDADLEDRVRALHAERQRMYETGTERVDADAEPPEVARRIRDRLGAQER